MQLMQHMMPGLLTTKRDIPVYFQDTRPLQPEVPEGAVLMKSGIVGIIAGAVGGVVSGVSDLVNTPGNNRTAQQIAAENTRQAEIAAMSSAQAQQANLAMVKYAAGAAVVLLTIYLLFR